MAFVYQSAIHSTPRLKQILITKQPTKTNYSSGESFDTTGMEVTAIYSNGLTKVITDYTYLPTGALTEDTTNIVVSYIEKGITKTANVPISVATTLSSIAVTKQPTKTVYKYNENFNSAGMEVTATYSNGNTAIVSGWTVDTTMLSTLGSQTITVTYTSGGITETTTLTVTVNAIELAVPSQSNTLTYTGSSQSPTWNNYNSSQLTLGGTTSGINATAYAATFTPRYGYSWSDGSTSAKEVNWLINRAKITTVPSQSNTLTYTGSSQSPTWNNYNSSQLTLGGTTSGINAGSYNANFTPKSNYMWSDSTTVAKTVGWSIGKAVPTITIPSSLGIIKTEEVITVTSNSGGTLTVTNLTTSVISVTKLTNTTFKVTPLKNGTAQVSVQIGETTNYKASVSTVLSGTVQMLVASEITDSWATIKQRSQNGTAANYYSVGSWKDVTIGGCYAVQAKNGTYTNLTQYSFDKTTFRAIILGIDHNKDYETPNGHAIHFYIGRSSGSTDGYYLLCLTEEVYGSGSQLVTMLDAKEFNRIGDAYSSSTKIANTLDHSPLLNMLTQGYSFVSKSDNSPAVSGNEYCYTIFEQIFPQDLRTNLNTNVRKETDYYSESFGHATTTLMNFKFMLLSEKEYLGTSEYTDGNTGRLSANQEQYDYFANGNSTEHRQYNNFYTGQQVWTRSWKDGKRGSRGIIVGDKSYHIDSDATNSGFGVLFFV